MKVTLYGIPSSHPVEAAGLMLDYKGIPHRRINFLPGLQRSVLRLLGFSGKSVPALKIDGRKVQGTREVALELDRIKPDPPLFPTDPEQRAKVDEVERWGDEFQQVPRTIIWLAMKLASTSDAESYLHDAKLGLPPWVLARTSAPLVALARKANDSYDPTVAKLIAELPEQLDKIDSWIADGVLDGDELNAADFQIATSLRLLMSMDDLREAIESRPASKLATRVQPDAPGRAGPVFPAAWLAPLREPVAN